MDQNTLQDKPLLSPGRGIAILFVTIGAFFYVLDATMSRDGGFTFKIFIAGIPLLLLGISMLILPPKFIIPSKYDELNKPSDYNSSFLGDNPKWKIAIWIGAALLGIIFRDAALRIFHF